MRWPWHRSRERVRKDPTQDALQKLIILWRREIRPDVERDISGYNDSDPIARPMTVQQCAINVLDTVEAKLVAHLVTAIVPETEQPYSPSAPTEDVNERGKVVLQRMRDQRRASPG